MARWLIAVIVSIGCESGAAQNDPEPEPSVSPACEKLCRLKSADEFGEHRGGTALARVKFRVECRKTIEAFNARHAGQGCAIALQQMGETVP